MKKIALVLLAAAAVTLSGCSRRLPAEKLFDYYNTNDMPWNEQKEFCVSEFGDVKFTWSSLGVGASYGDEAKELYWGMPVWGVYLADLNGDGKREICSAVSMGSGIVDERIYAYDLVHDRLYTLQDRFFGNYRLELKDGVLFFVRTPEHTDGETLSEPLTLDKMTEIDKAQI